MGTFDKVPSTGGKSYYNKRERDWWQQANLPEKLDYDYITLSLCRSYRDPLPSLLSKEVKSRQSNNGCVILRYGT
jgi:hypothetical protein